MFTQRTMILIFLTIVVIFWPLLPVLATPPADAKCSAGPVLSTQSNAEIVSGSNDDGKLTINVKFDNLYKIMNLGEELCIQSAIDDSLSEKLNGTIKQFFYTFSYHHYFVQYRPKNSYLFGIPEFTSDCKCDCPMSDKICSSQTHGKSCASGALCAKTYKIGMSNKGCQNQDTPASFCCDISVRPYQNRVFRAFKLDEAIPEVEVRIKQYVLSKDNKWNVIQSYTRKVITSQRTTLHLNGYENSMEMSLEAIPNAPVNTLAERYYYFDDSNGIVKANGKELNLMKTMEVADINSEGDIHKFGWLRRDAQTLEWSAHGFADTIRDVHGPVIKDCQAQLYLDKYNINNKRIYAIRSAFNNTISSEPTVGENIMSELLYLRDIEYRKFFPMGTDGRKVEALALTVEYTAKSAPVFKIIGSFEQKFHVRTLLKTAYAKDFVGEIRIDKFSKQFMNITLINAQGDFIVTLMESDCSSEPDVVLNAATDLPISANSTQILPLPPVVTTTRCVCLKPKISASSGIKPNCKMLPFHAEPLLRYELPKTFVESKGNCPGCNKAEDNTFWAGLNPKNWFNGINSWSEALALGVEVVVYFLILVLAVCLLRKVICPLVKWACCSGPNPRSRYSKHHEMCKSDIL